MRTKKEKTVHILIRKENNGRLIAVLPREAHSPGMLTCVTQEGEHAPCQWAWVRINTRRASEPEKKKMLSMLAGLGYTNVKLYKRLPTIHA